MKFLLYCVVLGSLTGCAGTQVQEERDQVCEGPNRMILATIRPTDPNTVLVLDQDKLNQGYVVAHICAARQIVTQK